MKLIAILSAACAVQHYAVTGTVRSAEQHEGLAGVVVRLDEHEVAITDEDGHYRLAGVAAGRHRIDVFYADRTVTQRVDVGASARSLDVDIATDQGPNCLACSHGFVLELAPGVALTPDVRVRVLADGETIDCTPITEFQPFDRLCVEAREVACGDNSVVTPVFAAIPSSDPHCKQIALVELDVLQGPHAPRIQITDASGTRLDRTFAPIYRPHPSCGARCSLVRESLQLGP
jgi:hypothetical protein